MSLLISFEENHSDAQAFIINKFQELGLVVLKDPENEHHIQVNAPDVSILEREAERLCILKHNKEGLLQEFEIEIKKKFIPYNKKSGYLFSPSQSNFLLLSFIENVTTDKVFVEKFQPGGQEGAELLETCVTLGIIECFFPPQAKRDDHEKLFKKAMYSLPGNTAVINEVNDHFGSEVALYLAFLDHLILWLIPPALFASVIFVVNYLDKDMDVNTNMMIPCFSIFIITWAVLFVQYFKQTCSGLTCKWGILSKSLLKTGDTSKVRSDFYGDLRVSKVTGRKEKFFEWYRRVPYYILSLLVTSVMLVIAFFVMVVSLNLQGYIHKYAMGAKLLHFSSISVYSEPGAYFDNKGGGPYPVVLPFVPVVLHAVVIMLLNTIYRHIAEYLTSLENHRTESNYCNSLLIKRYTADSLRRLGTETILPHLMHKWSGRHSAGVVAGNNDTFSEEKKSSAKMKANKKKKNKNKKNKDLFSEKIETEVKNIIEEDDKNEKEVSESLKTVSSLEPFSAEISNQFILDEYENFDDYLEMVISFGYITLFASAFPAASTLTLFCVILEMKSDIFKIFWISRKPNPRPVIDIGTWSNILTGLAWIAIITNVFLFAFTTEQMMQIFPSFFKIVEAHTPEASALVDEDYAAEYDTVDRQHNVVVGKQGLVWGYCFCFEHALLVFAGLITMIVPDRPSWVNEELERQEFVKDQESKQLHKLNLEKNKSKKND